jgi:hypothetical protein
MTLVLAACSGPAGNQQEAASGEAAGGGGGAPGAIALQAGMWEFTVEVAEMNIPNMPKGMVPMPPPTTIRNCLTPEQARAPDANFFSGKNEGGCTSQNMTFGGGRIAGTITCETPQGTTQVVLDGRYDATSYQMTQNIQAQMAGQSVNMQNRVNARRVGDCPA